MERRREGGEDLAPSRCTAADRPGLQTEARAELWLVGVAEFAAPSVEATNCGKGGQEMPRLAGNVARVWFVRGQESAWMASPGTQHDGWGGTLMWAEC